MLFLWGKFLNGGFAAMGRHLLVDLMFWNICIVIIIEKVKNTLLKDAFGDNKYISKCTSCGKLYSGGFAVIKIHTLANLCFLKVDMTLILVLDA